MKKLLILITLIPAVMVAQTWQQAHTFFLPRPVSSDVLIMHDGRMDMPAVNADDAAQLSISHTAFYKSSDNGDNNAPYFCGGSKKSIVFDQESKGDINPRWVGVWTDEAGKYYKSSVTVSPNREEWGMVLRAQQCFPGLHKGAWLAVTLPITEVTHKLNLTESVTSSAAVSTDSFKGVKEALSFVNWRAGKWASTSQTARGVGDMVWQMGIQVGEKSRQNYYLELSLPTSDKPTAQYLFEPVVGSAGHVGLGGGIQTYFPLFSMGDAEISYAGHLHYRYLFEAKQQRTFDCKGQSFSRYLLYLDTIMGVNDNYLAYAANGVNFFTRTASVDPGSTGQNVSSICLNYKQHQFRIGYNYWWRTAEQVDLAGAVQRTFAVPVKGAPTASRQWLPSPLVKEDWYTDTQNDATVQRGTVLADAVTDNELDMASGGAPFTASHTVLLSYAGEFPLYGKQLVLGAGGAYEMAENSAALNGWSAWLTLGLQF